MEIKGKVYIIGAGPGDPGLITLRGVECLREADVVIYDYLVGGDILLHAGEKARLIYAGKKGKDHTIPQAEINALLIREASAGNVVARLKGGDPFLFGRGGEEAEALVGAGIPFEIVPGVTSAMSVPAYAGIPITHRGFASTVAFVTGHEDPTKDKSDIDWKALAQIGTLVFLMGVKNLPAIAANLIENGKDPATPAALIRWGTTPEQETLVATLGDIVRRVEETGFRPPAILVVGPVVEQRERLNWFETKPLFGRGVVITRPPEQAAEFTALLRAQGARVLHFPTIKIVPADDRRDLDRAIGAIGNYQWIIFTSANGVGHFFRRLRDLGKDIRDLKGTRICAIGPATAGAVEDRGIKVDLVPASFISEGVIEAFRGENIKGSRILLPRAETAREVIPAELAKLGATVDVVTVYRTASSGRQKSELEAWIGQGKVDVITFTSSSTVTNFVEIMGRGYSPPPQVKIACIGPVTAGTAEKAGMKIDIMQEKYTIPGLVEGIVAFYRSGGK
ncbi:MAG: uroporphyrinogen-III C-methyltransferase [Deltaproteobacteria bacterium]|nr:uroporphyrinogen-III C-methyltransferase [Deltaproteobacteria bacterium]